MPILQTARRLLQLFFRSLFWSLNIGLVLYTLLAYWLLYDLPVQHWSASMVMITLPVAWVLNGLYVALWLFANRWRAVLSGLTLLAGFWLWPRTLALNTAEPNNGREPTLSLLSYNVANFRSDEFYNTPPKRKKAQQITDWVVEHEAPVKCFQEFYNSQRHPTLHMAKRLRDAGYRYEAMLNPYYFQVPDCFIGVAIYSKYPIVQQGREPFEQHTHNGIVWADIAVGTDTIRIVNVHLESMGIRVGRVLKQEEMAGVRAETRGILSLLREGFMARQGQIRRVENYITGSRYPVIVTGDFNDTPYSVTYGRMRQRFSNAFEEAGQGFGFTLNRAPNFLRIDNQFYDATRLTAHQFKTYRDVPFSDHFPIWGEYLMRGE